MPGALIGRHSIRVQVVRYDVEGWGVGELYLEAETLLYHELPRLGPRPRDGDGHPLGERIKEYFRGGAVDFGDVQIDLEWATPFQSAVAGVLRTVPYGEVVTYGELAALAGHPNAQRAAGTFCAHNRFPLILPCHRVVAAQGLGSYGSLGLDYKRRLLELEGAL
jgi:methylated-DNA-[protein]-cysteine S-methyltransferase